nr:uncharacterized protein KIAA2012 homolog [Meriones unguiculatus]
MNAVARELDARSRPLQQHTGLECWRHGKLVQNKQKLEVYFEPEDYLNWKSPEDYVLVSKAQDGDGASQHSWSLFLPKTFSTRKGALILYSEGLAVSAWAPRERRRSHRKRRDLELHTLHDLREAILAYGRRKREQDRAWQPYLYFRSKPASQIHRQMQPGYSAKRYLRGLLRTWPPDTVDRLQRAGHIKDSVLLRDSRLGIPKNLRPRQDLSGVPPKYHLLPVVPSFWIQQRPSYEQGLGRWLRDSYGDQGSAAQNHYNPGTHLTSLRKQPWQEDETRAKDALTESHLRVQASEESHNGRTRQASRKARISHLPLPSDKSLFTFFCGAFPDKQGNVKPHKAGGGCLSQEPPAERCLFPPIASARGSEQSTLGEAEKRKAPRALKLPRILEEPPRVLNPLRSRFKGHEPPMELFIIPMEIHFHTPQPPREKACRRGAQQPLSEAEEAMPLGRPPLKRLFLGRTRGLTAHLPVDSSQDTASRQEDGDILAQSVEQPLGPPPPIKGKKSPEIQRDLDSNRTPGCSSPPDHPVERILPAGPDESRDPTWKHFLPNPEGENVRLTLQGLMGTEALPQGQANPGSRTRPHGNLSEASSPLTQAAGHQECGDEIDSHEEPGGPHRRKDEDGQGPATKGGWASRGPAVSQAEHEGALLGTAAAGSPRQVGGVSALEMPPRSLLPRSSSLASSSSARSSPPTTDSRLPRASERASVDREAPRLCFPPPPAGAAWSRGGAEAPVRKHPRPLPLVPFPDSGLGFPGRPGVLPGSPHPEPRTVTLDPSGTPPAPPANTLKSMNRVYKVSHLHRRLLEHEPASPGKLGSKTTPRLPRKNKKTQAKLFNQKTKTAISHGRELVDKANRKKRTKTDKGKAHKREREERVPRQAEAVRGKSKGVTTEKKSQPKEKKPETKMKRKHKERNVEMAAELSKPDVTNPKEAEGTSERGLLPSHSAPEDPWISSEYDALESQVSIDGRLPPTQDIGIPSNMESEEDRSPEDPFKALLEKRQQEKASPDRIGTERAEMTWLEAERRREQELLEQLETTEKMKEELELEHQRHAEEIRLRKQRLEEVRQLEEEAERKQRLRFQAAQERARKQQEAFRKKLQEMQRKKQQEEVEKAETKKQRQKELDMQLAEEQKRLMEMTEEQRLEYLWEKRQEEKARWEAEESRQQEEKAARLTLEEARKLVQEQIRQKAAFKEHYFRQELSKEANGLQWTQNISRPWVYSYFQFLDTPKP